MKINRRVFLKTGGLALVSMGAVPSFMVRALSAATEPSKSSRRPRVLVCIFQRGAVDGLNMVIPHGETAYYAGRPTIAIGRPRRGSSESALDLDEFFGLHPAMRSLLPAWQDKQLGILHAVGSPHATRSHFDAQDFMESAIPGRKGVSEGWLNRVLQDTTPEERASAFRGVAIAATKPRSLAGPVPTLSMADLKKFDLRTRARRTGPAGEVLSDFERLYETSGDEIVAPAGRESLQAAETLRALDPGAYRPRPEARYPAGPFGNSLKQIAQLVKADVGLEIAFTESGGWDHHANEGNHVGILARMLGGFSQGLEALRVDLGERFDDVLILTMSEFGRTVRENGTRGTDHGHANVMLLLGGDVRGGKIHGRWPGLAPEQLYDGRDLALTTDFRDVFAEVAQKHLGAENLKALFPGFRPSPKRFRGLLL